MFIKVIRITFGVIISLVGFIGTGVGIISTIDPVGSKMADDADPFGPPGSTMEGAIIMIVYLVIFLFGLWLLFAKKWRNRKTA